MGGRGGRGRGGGEGRGHITIPFNTATCLLHFISQFYSNFTSLLPLYSTYSITPPWSTRWLYILHSVYIFFIPLLFISSLHTFHSLCLHLFKPLLFISSLHPFPSLCLHLFIPLLVILSAHPFPPPCELSFSHLQFSDFLFSLFAHLSCLFCCSFPVLLLLPSSKFLSALSSFVSLLHFYLNRAPPTKLTLLILIFCSSLVSPYFSSTWTYCSPSLSLSSALFLSPLSSTWTTAHPYLLLFFVSLHIFCPNLFTLSVFFFRRKEKEETERGGWLSSLGHESEICPYF